MGKSGKRVGKVTPPRSMNRENKDNRMWWWVGGGGGLILVVAAVIWFAGGPRGAISETPSPSGTEEETSSMPENPTERNGMYNALPEMEIDPAKTYVGTITTEKGDIIVELDAGAAPETVNNFVFLAREGFYDDLTFHRVVPDFVIQGGDPLGSGTGGPGYTVPAEIDLEHVKGAIAMARRSDDVNPERASSGSQFYITLEATPHLDGVYTVFGEVVEGMDVVESIAQGDVIESITITEEG
jgi:cyclophilin family peptidyl-prolyl cis-trans isomerase